MAVWCANFKTISCFDRGMADHNWCTHCAALAESTRAFGRQAIVTKFLPITAKLPSRVKATCDGGSLVLSWADSLDVPQNHARVAQALARKLEWPGEYRCGGMPKAGSAFAYVFVCVKGSAFTVA